MDKITRAFYNLLKHNIKHPITKEEIPLIINSLPFDNIPCITFNTASNTLIKQYRHSERLKDYPYPVELKTKQYRIVFWINIWANNEKERLKLQEQVNNYLEMIEDNHYLVCGNYNSKTSICSTTNNTCEVLTKPEHYLSRKNRCPSPETNKPKGFFKSNNIIKRTYFNDGSTNHDENDKTAPILHTRISLNMEYQVHTILGGSKIEDIRIEIN